MSDPLHTIASATSISEPSGNQESASLMSATTGLGDLQSSAGEASTSRPGPVAVSAVSDSNATTANIHDENDGSPPLLREWQYNETPVAPAMVVAEPAPSNPVEQPSPLSNVIDLAENHVYPVATFVRDFVRTSVDQIHDQIQDQINHHSANLNFDPRGDAEDQQSQQQQQQSTTSDEQATFPLSVRSEADLTNLMTAAHPAPHAISARTVNDMMNEEAEFILVDGDLIALPPSHPNEGLDSLTRNHQPKACRPNRMRRGVRKIGKFFGRNKKNKHLQYQQGSSIESTSIASVDVPPLDPGLPPLGMDNNQRSLIRQTSLGDDSGHSKSPGRRAKPKVRNQRVRSWRQRAGSRDAGRSQTDSDSARERTDSYEIGRQGTDSRDAQRDLAREFYMAGEEDHTIASVSMDDGSTSVSVRSTGTLPAASSTQFPAAAAAQMDPLRPPQQVAFTGMSPIAETSTEGRTQSVTATPLGTEVEVLGGQENGLIPAMSAEAFIEYEFYDDERAKKEEIPASLVPKDADFKVEKSDAPDVETMLLRAAHETTTDLDHQYEIDRPIPRLKGKSDGTPVPLSQATKADKIVLNDMLKVMCVGSVGAEKSVLARAIRESNKKPKKRTTLGLDVHNWSQENINFHIWDVQGATHQPGANNDNAPNFGAHPSTQSLFFSAESLYLLVWDLACQNPHSHPVFDYDSDEEDEYANEYAREQAIVEADRVLQEDISSRVLAWVDRIARRAPRSAVLPVAVIPDGMEPKEVQRRCSKMFEMLESHMKWYESAGIMPNIVLDDSRNVLSVNFSQNFGVKQLQETIVAIAKDSSGSVFQHVGTEVPDGTVEVLEFVKRHKQDHKLIRLDHIMGELSDYLTYAEVIRALHFLSNVGEILYFGMDGDDILSSFVILSRQWMVSAISCILRNDLKREIADTRKFMNLQCLYSEEQYEESEITKVLTQGAATNCPLLSDGDAKMLWQSMSFMREAADRYSQVNENTTSGITMFHYLQHLLVHFGIFLPFGNINMNQDSAGLASLDQAKSEVFFVPSLLSQIEPGEVWSYRCSDAWTTTLCNSWLFRDGAPSDLFENLTVALLRDLYIYSRQFSSPIPKAQPLRAHTSPLGLAGKHEFVEDHSSQSIGAVRIHQIICWESSMLLKIGTLFPDRESDELRESIVEVFVTIVDQNSSRSIASDAMRGSMQRVIVSGKGQSGLNGLKLFKGGYQAVLDSVQSSLSPFNNVNSQIVCPECLARGNPRRASTWGLDEVAAAAEERSESTIVCRRGHRVKSGLLYGTCKEEATVVPSDLGPAKPVPELLPSVVIIGLVDPQSQEIRSVGSGFFADKKFGLIITAGHVLFNMEEGNEEYGAPYLNIPNARIAIGVIPDKDKKKAIWRYWAEIVADDVRNNVDACVLRLTTKMEQDIDEDVPNSNLPVVQLEPATIKDQNLNRLKLETNFELEQPVRIIGYSQGDLKRDEKQTIIRSPDFDKGFIVRVFSTTLSDDSSSSSDSESESRNTFTPREEIVVKCPTIVGHSGGPCVSDDGGVVGILSRADPTDSHRCFLVPAGQLKTLLKRAKGLCSRPVYPAASLKMPPRYTSSA